MNYKTRKKSTGLLFAICVIILFAIVFGAILANPNTQNAWAQGDLLEESEDFQFEKNNLQSSNTDYSLLTWSDFEYLFTLESNHRSENLEITPDEMIEYLETEIADIILQKQNSFSTYSYPEDIFGLGLTSQEILWFVSYPAQGIIAYNSSQDATAKMKELYSMPGGEMDNTNYNAFKHAYWNALMEKRISKNYLMNIGTPQFPWYTTVQIDFAEGFATAHEYGWDVIYPKSTEMDLANNALGRIHGATYGHLSDHNMALELAGRITQGAFWRILYSGDIDYDRIYGTIVSTNHEELKLQYIYHTTDLANNAIRIDGVSFNPVGTLNIPATINGRTVTTIAPYAFQNQKGLTGVTFPSTITTLGHRAFQFCTNLTYVDMSAATIAKIDDYTFDTYDPNTGVCNPLTTLKFPNGLTEIGNGAFIRNGSPTKLPNTVKTIGEYAFAYGPSTWPGFRLSDDLETIGAYAFAYTNNAAIVLTYEGSKLKTIGEYAFYGTLLPTNTQVPASVTSVGKYAFCNSGFSPNFALPPNSQLTSIGEGAFQNCGITRIVLPLSITSIGAGAFNGNTELTIYTERSYTATNPSWNGSNRPIVWGCTLSADKSYVVSFTKSSTNPTYRTAANGITNPYRKDYSFGGWYTTSDFSGTQYTDLTAAPNGTLYAKWNTSSCVAEGTLITLADGSQVAVENLTGNEMLLVWNMFTGTFDAAPILFIDSDPFAQYEIIHLYFSDGTEVKVIDEHAFWDIDLNKYVFLRNDAGQYIGHWFNKQTTDENGDMTWTAVQLIGVDIYWEATTAWSPVTFGHLCFYVNGMLSMPGSTTGLINIFDVDGETMQIDEDAYLADVEEYGLFTYEEFAEIFPIPEIIFEAFGGQFLKVSIGKGLIDLDGIAALIERYAPFFDMEE